MDGKKIRSKVFDENGDIYAFIACGDVTMIEINYGTKPFVYDLEQEFDLPTKFDMLCEFFIENFSGIWNCIQK